MPVQTTKNNHSGLTISHAIELKQYLKEKYGIVSVVGDDETLPITEAKASGKTGKFDVYFENGYDRSKTIGIVKVIRELTGKDLTETKEMIHHAPKLIKEDVDKDTAEDFKVKLEEAGAKVSIKPKHSLSQEKDHVEEPVQQFLEDVISMPTPPVIEVDGQHVHFVVRPKLNESINEPWTDAKNQRRYVLIDKDVDGTITPEEVVELVELQTQMRRHVNKVAPLPMAGARKLHAELLAKAASASGQS